MSFSNVSFREIAPFVGLDPIGQIWLCDAPRFNLHRSRIPTSLFKAIVEDMDILLTQYGNLRCQATEEARSCFLAPIFNHLVAQFGGSIKNMPEPLPEPLRQGCITTRGRMDYHFKAFGTRAVMFVEVKQDIGPLSERVNAIAQVIAECYACDFNNRQHDTSIPIYGILCDGSTFQFFSFDGNTKPYKFSIGLDPGTQFQVIPLTDFSFQPTAHSFIHSLRPICEIVFNLLLLTYIASLKIWVPSMPCEGTESQPGQERIGDCDKALRSSLRFAEDALEKSQNAEVLRQDGLIAMADVITEAAFQDLRHSTDAVPYYSCGLYDDPPLMASWNEEEVSKV
ncbi:hypothetical protein V8E53_008202 [Lactarius tabidus]